VRVALPKRPRLQPEAKLGDNAEVGLAEQPIDGMDPLDPMGDTYWQLVRRLKRCLDPDGILAPAGTCRPRRRAETSRSAPATVSGKQVSSMSWRGVDRALPLEGVKACGLLRCAAARGDTHDPG
jgi:hypothetical protein